jgi:hypothetical protein
MADLDYRVLDALGNVVSVGSRVLYADESLGTVLAISDPDADYDDELGRGVFYPPKVTVRLDDGEQDAVSTYRSTQITWADYPDGPAIEDFTCDDIEVK